MKKILYVLSIIVMMVLFVGCPKKQPLTEQEKCQKEWEAYIDENIYEDYDDAEFIDEYEFENGEVGTVTWTTSNTNAISARGRLQTIPFDEEVVITSTVKIEGMEDIVVAKTVKAYGEMTYEEFMKKFEDMYIPNAIYGDIVFTDKESQILKNIGYKGDITYTSSDETILTNDGKLLYTGTTDTTIDINYSIVYRSQTYTGTKKVTIIGSNNKNTETGKYETYKTEWNTYISNLIPAYYESTMTWPTEFTFRDKKKAVITYSTSNEKSISSHGHWLANAVDNEVTITSYVIVEGVGTFSVDTNTICKGINTVEAYKERFESEYLPDSTYESIHLESVEDKICSRYGYIGEISYSSSNTNIIGNNGEYNITQADDQVVAFNYTILINGLTITGSKDILVYGKKDNLRVEHGINWLANTWEKVDTVIDDIALPNTDDVGIVHIVWESNTPSLIDDSGKLYDYQLDKELILTAKVYLNKEVQTMEVRFNTLPKDKALEYIMDRMHKNEIFQSYFKTYVVTSGYKNADYGFLNFYVQDIDERQIVMSEPGLKVNGSNVEYTPGTLKYGTRSNNTNTNLRSINTLISYKDYKRPHIIKSSTEFICVHDTGDNKFTAAQWAEEVHSSARVDVSWHFTVDDTSIYQQIPIDEVAWHAGSGSTRYGLIDTGVKYTVRNPKIEFKEDGNLYINDIKTTLKAPFEEGRYQTAITKAWLYTERGANGNYYINKYYYNSTYKVVSNNGGNYNSVGIETCIKDDMKYSKVMRNNANLVAHLLNIYNLDTTRVTQHRNFSGKLCPQSMIRADEKTQFTWDNFMELVEIEYFIIKNLPNLKVTYNSLNPDVVDNNGVILKYVTEPTTVKYSVRAEYDGKVFEKTYTTVINPKTE